MNKYIVDPELGRKLREAVRFLTDSQGWAVLADYEQEILKALREKDNNLSISHPHYERMKAYIQGQINGLSYLIESRKGIKDGTKNGRRTKTERSHRVDDTGFED